MTAIGRAPTGKPKLILLDEPSMGLAPQLVEEIFEIVSKLNTQERVSFLLAEQNRMVALRFPDVRLRPGEWACGTGRRRETSRKTKT